MTELSQLKWDWLEMKQAQFNSRYCLRIGIKKWEKQARSEIDDITTIKVQEYQP